jgi:hypothetical protein
LDANKVAALEADESALAAAAHRDPSIQYLLGGMPPRVVSCTGRAATFRTGTTTVRFFMGTVRLFCEIVADTENEVFDFRLQVSLLGCTVESAPHRVAFAIIVVPHPHLRASGTRVKVL